MVTHLGSEVGIPPLVDGPLSPRAGQVREHLLVFIRLGLQAFAAKHRDKTETLSALLTAQEGLCDWTRWLVIADWLEENGAGTFAPGLRRMVEAYRSVTRPEWWLDFDPLLLNCTARFDDFAVLRTVVSTLKNKPFPE